jgi:archaemetzincin
MQGAGYDVPSLERVIEKLAPLHPPLGAPQPGDWLAHHDEAGQSFAAYRRQRPTLPDERRHTLYVQPLGDLSPTHRRVIELTADYMGRFFNLPVKRQPDLPLAIIPPEARRVHPTWGDAQILSTYVLDDVLRPRLPQDAAAYLALTASDLWPGEGWNFVFGQASLRHRVGVWSIYRKGDPTESEAAFTVVLRRTLHTAVHETGHMFSIQHCTAHPCVMCGSNSLDESDRRPLWLCPQCLAKISWGMKIAPVDRYRSLFAFAKRHRLEAEERFFEQSLQALGAASGSSSR